MKITKLYIQNFLSVGRIKCSLDEKGLVLIQGENRDDTSQDSNGSGKSSFADAISWCLYGVTARGDTGDSVINRSAKKDCQVFVHIEDGENCYFVERNRKHKTHKNSLRVGSFVADGAAYTDLSKGTDKETQKVVNTIMGCSQEVFNAAIYAGQEQMVDLPGMTDKQLKTLVEEAAGVDRLQKAHALAQSDARTAKSKHEIQVMHHESLVKTVSLIKEEIENAELHAHSWDATHKKDLKNAIDAAKGAKAEWERLEETRADLDESIKQIDDKSKEHSERIAKISSEKIERDRLYKDVLERQSQVAERERAEKNCLAETRKVASELKNVKEHIGKPCGECGKNYTEDDMANVIKAKKEKGRKLRDEAAEVNAEIVDAQEALENAQKRLRVYESMMTDISEETRSEALRMSEKRDLEAKLRIISKAKDIAVRAANDAKSIKARTNPHHATVERLKSRLEGDEKLASEAWEDVLKDEQTARLKEQVVKVLGPAGVRAYILDTVTPFLNACTSNYLNVLTDGNISAIWNTLSTTAKGELREKFSIQVSSTVGADSFRGLSGGEKRKVRLACSMALQDLVSSRATKPIDLYIADEIDHALDESGLERLTSILDEKARTKGTALVISHNALNSYIRQAVTVVKEKGTSHLEGEALDG